MDCLSRRATVAITSAFHYVGHRTSRSPLLCLCGAISVFLILSCGAIALSFGADFYVRAERDWKVSCVPSCLLFPAVLGGPNKSAHVVWTYYVDVLRGRITWTYYVPCLGPQCFQSVHTPNSPFDWARLRRTPPRASPRHPSPSCSTPRRPAPLPSPSCPAPLLFPTPGPLGSARVAVLQAAGADAEPLRERPGCVLGHARR